MRVLLATWLLVVVSAARLRVRSRSKWAHNSGAIGSTSGSGWSPASAIQGSVVGTSFAQKDAIDGVALVTSRACDLVSYGDVCFASTPGKQHVLAPPAVALGLQARYTFDESTPLDSSGNNLHASTSVKLGPSPSGGGHSAIFNGNVLVIPHSTALPARDFTYSVWIYVVADNSHRSQQDTPVWCPILRKGVNNLIAQSVSSSPGISIQPRTGSIRGTVTTTAGSAQEGEHVDSNARLSKNRWMHLALVHHSQRRSLLLYVNGVLDASIQLGGDVQPNEFPLYVGGDPFQTVGCRSTVYMDDLSVYSRALAPHELHAEGLAALGVDPAFALLGCTSCSLAVAAASCPPDRHICTALELHTGGYQMARAMGWMKAGVHVWTFATSSEDPGGPAWADVLGLALCCEGSPP